MQEIISCNSVEEIRLVFKQRAHCVIIVYMTWCQKWNENGSSTTVDYGTVQEDEC
jgi:hypothetical protein